MKYVVVLHSWFVDCEGFKVEEIEAEDENAAYREAVFLKHKMERSHKSVAFKIVPIGDTEKFMPRKLTWRERLTGRIKKL